MKFNYYYTKWILLGLIIIAGALRYFILNTISLTLDEQLIWFIGTGNTPFDSLISITKYKPFNLILGITSWLTSSNELKLEIVNRCITLFAGIIAVPLSFILTRKFYSELEGLIVAGFITLSWNCIAASQNIAEYSLLLVFILLYFIAIISFLDRISEESFVSKQESIFFIISGLLLGFISIWGILVILISFFYSFFFVTKIKIFLKTIKKFAFIIIPLGLFCWWGLYQNIYTDTKYSAIDYLNSINYIIANNFILSFIIIAPIFYLIFLYIKRLFNKEEFGEDAKTKFNNSTLIISIWLAVSIIGFVLITLFMQINFTTNDLIFILPPLFILIARSIVLISSKLEHKIIIASVFSLIFLFSTFINLENIDNKPEYNSVARYIMYIIKNDTENKYAIMMIADKNNMFTGEAYTYYLKKNGIKSKLFLLNNNIDSINFDLSKQNINYIWFIADNSYVNEKIILELKNNGFIQTGYRYKGITLYKLSFALK